MPIEARGVGGVYDEIALLGDLAGEIGMRCVDACINERNSHAGTTRPALRFARTDRGEAALQTDIRVVVRGGFRCPCSVATVASRTCVGIETLQRLCELHASIMPQLRKRRFTIRRRRDFKQHAAQS